MSLLLPWRSLLGPHEILSPGRFSGSLHHDFMFSLMPSFAYLGRKMFDYIKMTTSAAY
jgi:hypothetical protein